VLSRYTAVKNPAIGLSGGDRQLLQMTNSLMSTQQLWPKPLQRQRVTYIGCLLLPKTQSLPPSVSSNHRVYLPCFLGTNVTPSNSNFLFSQVVFAMVLADLLGHSPDVLRLTCRLLGDIGPQHLNSVCTNTNAVREIQPISSSTDELSLRLIAGWVRRRTTRGLQRSRGEKLSLTMQVRLQRYRE
jgi:hypothetical protein